MPLEIPTIKLNNGVQMPVFGLGTWQEHNVCQIVKDAIDMGYRLFDCGYICKIQRLIGTAFQEKLHQGVVTRKDLFIISKLWCNVRRPDLIAPAILKTLKNLETTYLDMVLIHWPMAFQQGEELHPKNVETGEYLYSNVDYIDTWKQLETLYRKKLIRAIGVSNFNMEQIQRILNNCAVFPQVNQMECHPYFHQKQLRTFCENNGIIVSSDLPLGPQEDEFENLNFIRDPNIEEIANRYRKYPEQILLKYNIQLGNVVIQNTHSKSSMAKNLNIFDFYLALEDMSYLNSFNRNERMLRFEEAKQHPYYPFNCDEF
ncbi:hypothetical protein Zmor_023812 [Zophobas morio]|uniref:NADP-dependent oxidoreductase domain-containing protein n=2 Tax=Zophobas morio TaxID=2755281 RepID=A0AA38HZX6_9CUCU|nr:hypothetical protein Zmor_023812 [Zophobas morio]